MFRPREKFNFLFAFLYLASMALAAIQYGLDTWWLAAYGLHFLIFTFGVGFGFHRTLAHGAVDSYLLPKRLAYLTGMFANVGSPWSWALNDFSHHQYADTPEDLHSPAHHGAKVLAGYMNPKKASTPIETESAEKYLRFLHSNYYLILGCAVLAAGAIAGVKGILFLALIPSGLSFFACHLTNYFNHRSTGYRNFETPETSNNLWWLWPLTFGENWHNNHHHNPQAKSNRVKWWECDLIAVYCYLFDRGSYTRIRIHFKKWLLRFRWRSKDYVYFKPSN